MKHWYMVRGKDADGIRVYADEDESGEILCNPNEGTMLLVDEPAALDTVAGWRAEMVRLGCADARIYRVNEAWSATPVLTYEEALEQLGERDEILAKRDALFDAASKLTIAVRSGRGVTEALAHLELVLDPEGEEVTGG